MDSEEFVDSGERLPGLKKFLRVLGSTEWKACTFAWYNKQYNGWLCHSNGLVGVQMFKQLFKRKPQIVNGKRVCIECGIPLQEHQDKLCFRCLEKKALAIMDRMKKYNY